MQILITIGALLASYLLGSIPFGLLIVKLGTGKDIREVESGRTGGTNAMRAAGLWAGLATAGLDMFKATVAVWVVRALAPQNYWLHIFIPVMSILGHNYSLFLVERGEDGRLHFRGGAGGAPSVGGAAGLWFPSFFFIVPLGALIFYFVGYASITTLSTALIAILIFAIRAWNGLSPWEYVVYGLIAEILLIWALRPNLRRLLNGTERVVGWRARKHAKNQ